MQGWHPCFSQSRPKKKQPALVANLEADPFVGHALRSLPSLWQVPGTANRWTNNKEALSIWTSMPSDNKRWCRTNRRRRGWKEWRTQQLLTQFRRRLKTKEQKPKESSSCVCRLWHRKAKMLEALRAAKEWLRSSAVPSAGEASIPPKEAESKDQEHADKRSDVPVVSQQPDHNREGQTNWTTWIIGACHAGALIVSKLQQTEIPASVMAGPAIKCDSTPMLHADKLQASSPVLSNYRFPLIPLLWSKLNTATNMTTPATDGKMLVNALYHSAVVSVLAMGYTRLGKMVIGGAPP